MHEVDHINPSVPPSGPGCVECLASGGWWFHLRRCAECGQDSEFEKRWPAVLGTLLDT